MDVGPAIGSADALESICTSASSDWTYPVRPKVVQIFIILMLIARSASVYPRDALNGRPKTNSIS